MADLNAMRWQYARMLECLQSVQLENATLRKSSARQSELEAENAALREQADELKDTNNKQNQSMLQMVKAQAALEELKQSNKALEEQCAAANAEVAESRKQLELANADAATARAHLDMNQRTMQEQEAELLSLRKQRSEAQDEHFRMQNSMKELEKRLKEEQEAIEQLHRRHSAASEEELARLHTELVRAAERANKLERNNVKLIQDNHNLQQRATALQSQTDQLEKDCDELRSEVEQSRSMSVEAADVRSRLAETEDEQARQRSQWAEELQALHVENQQLRERLVELQEQLGAYKPGANRFAQYVDLKSENLQLQTELKSLRQRKREHTRAPVMGLNSETEGIERPQRPQYDNSSGARGHRSRERGAGGVVPHLDFGGEGNIFGRSKGAEQQRLPSGSQRGGRSRRPRIPRGPGSLHSSPRDEPEPGPTFASSSSARGAQRDGDSMLDERRGPTSIPVPDPVHIETSPRQRQAL